MFLRARSSKGNEGSAFTLSVECFPVGLSLSPASSAADCGFISGYSSSFNFFFKCHYYVVLFQQFYVKLSTGLTFRLLLFHNKTNFSSSFGDSD